MINLSKWIFCVVNFCSFAFWDKVVDFGKNILGSAAQAFGGSVGGAAANYVIGAPDPAYTQEEIKEQITLGNQLDLSNQKEMFDYRINQGVEAGMTPYEMYMGPAAGAGGGTTGSGQTLGNAASQKNVAAIQAQQQQRNQFAQNATALAQTKMQTDAQRDVAEISAGVQTRGQDIDQAIREGALELDRERLNKIDLPQAAATLKKTEQETRKLINEVVTSNPKFLTAMKQLSMGHQNLLVELFLRDQKISLSDPDSFMSKSAEERAAILTKLIALSSNVYSEAKGAASLGKEGGTSNPVDKAADWIANIFPTGEGIEQTGALPNKPVLGNYGPKKRGRGYLPRYKNFSRDFPGR